jgi:hypothetical protein
LIKILYDRSVHLFAGGRHRPMFYKADTGRQRELLSEA